jgi:hypothetical protein
MAVMQAAPVYAATKKTCYVANNGEDTFTCGTKAQPCRSINFAFACTMPAGIVAVGPGIYGDINGSGTVGDLPGEEPTLPSSGCMIDILWPLTLVSTDGAGSTVLDTGGDPAARAAVCIRTADASGAVFGKLNKGFTIRNSLGTGPGDVGGTGLDLEEADGVKVEGNIAIGTRSGMSIGFQIGGRNATLKNNIASDWEGGFYVISEGVVLTGNLAKGNTGMGGEGGFRLDGLSGAVVTKNSAIANGAAGFELWLYPSETFTFSKNTALGNARGLQINANTSSGPVSVAITKNNFFGNGDLTGLSAPYGPNCGLVVRNDAVANPVTVNAAGNFWGAATGPGPNPADAAGGADCSWDSGGGITLTTVPVATAKIPLYPPKMK